MWLYILHPYASAAWWDYLILWFTSCHWSIFIPYCFGSFHEIVASYIDPFDFVWSGLFCETIDSAFQLRYIFDMCHSTSKIVPSVYWCVPKCQISYLSSKIVPFMQHTNGITNWIQFFYQDEEVDRINWAVKEGMWGIKKTPG